MKTLLTTLHSKYIHATLALPYLAAYCGDECGEILIEEFTVHEPKEKVMAAIMATGADVVAFSVYLWNRRETLELIDALSVAKPEIKLVIGGPEVSFDSIELFHQHPGLTALVRGEGETPVKALLQAWNQGEYPERIQRLTVRGKNGIEVGEDSPPLEDLDTIPSPFEAGLVDLSRGLVYLETSRGCPYSCAFCMSALDDRVRSFSMERIKKDLDFLMQREIPTIKLVDRTFNYHRARAREIFSYILENNRSSLFHFEIGADLLDEQTLDLLSSAPKDVFQFEIGVQSTHPETLAAIRRGAKLEGIEKSVRRLVEMGNIHLHLDLIAGLPGQDFNTFLDSIDRVLGLGAEHLQVEPVKLLPGSPLRRDAESLDIGFDPNPPYAVLQTPDLDFFEIERLRGISRLLDLVCNSECFEAFLSGLQSTYGSIARGLATMEEFWRNKDLFRHPLSRKGVFLAVWDFVRNSFEGNQREELRERLGIDFARSERVVQGKAPEFLTTDLSPSEEKAVKTLVKEETEAIKGQGIKLQHFAAIFHHLPQYEGRTLLLFIYLTKTGEGMRVEERRVSASRL